MLTGKGSTPGLARVTELDACPSIPMQLIRKRLINKISFGLLLWNRLSILMASFSIVKQKSHQKVIPQSPAPLNRIGLPSLPTGRQAKP
jgi:hypothetical protein